LARLGVGIQVTAPTIHAGFGFTGDAQHPGTRIRLEIWSCGPLHVCLEKGMKVCQLILEEVHGTPNNGYEGMLAEQGPQTGQPKPGPSGRRPGRRRKE
jgi:dCTP deaminase